MKTLITTSLILTLVACGGISEKALVKAAYNGQTAIVEKALDGGADLNLRSKVDGPTLLSYAAGAGQSETVFVLLDRGADPHSADANGWTALHFASSGGHTDVINLLVRSDADINARTTDGWTPLMYAVFGDDVDTAMNLISNGADAAIELPNGMNALIIAQEKSLDTMTNIIQSALRIQE